MEECFELSSEEPRSKQRKEARERGAEADPCLESFPVPGLDGTGYVTEVIGQRMGAEEMLIRKLLGVGAREGMGVDSGGYDVEDVRARAAPTGTEFPVGMGTAHRTPADGPRAEASMLAW